MAFQTMPISCMCHLSQYCIPPLYPLYLKLGQCSANVCITDWVTPLHCSCGWYYMLLSQRVTSPSVVAVRTRPWKTIIDFPAINPVIISDQWACLPCKLHESTRHCVTFMHLIQSVNAQSELINFALIFCRDFKPR